MRAPARDATTPDNANQRLAQRDRSVEQAPEERGAVRSPSVPLARSGRRGFTQAAGEPVSLPAIAGNRRFDPGRVGPMRLNGAVSSRPEKQEARPQKF